MSVCICSNYLIRKCNGATSRESCIEDKSIQLTSIQYGDTTTYDTPALYSEVAFNNGDEKAPGT